MPDAKRPDVSKMSFEDALAELEQIVRSLEGGQQKLEDAITATRHGESRRIRAVAAPMSMHRFGDGPGGSGSICLTKSVMKPRAEITLRP